MKETHLSTIVSSSFFLQLFPFLAHKPWPENVKERLMSQKIDDLRLACYHLEKLLVPFETNDMEILAQRIVDSGCVQNA